MAPLPEPVRKVIPRLQKALDRQGIPWCLAGSAALWMWGYRDREPHDVDVLVGASREHIYAVFERDSKMVTDVEAAKKVRSKALVQYYYTDAPQAPMPIDFFLINMENIRTVSFAGAGLATTPVFEKMVGLKAKLHALATRGQLKDKKDITWLLGSMRQQEIKANELDPTLLGLALLNFPDLESAFKKIQINLDSCRQLGQVYREQEPRMSPEVFQDRMDLSKRIVTAIREGLPQVQQPIPLFGPPQVRPRGRYQQSPASAVAGPSSPRPSPSSSQPGSSASRTITYAARAGSSSGQVSARTGGSSTEGGTSMTANEAVVAARQFISHLYTLPREQQQPALSRLQQHSSQIYGLVLQGLERLRQN